MPATSVTTATQTQTAPPIPQADPAEQILRSVQGVDDNARANAWDAFHQSQNEDELAQRLQNSNLPQNVKADLWDAKRNSKSSLSEVRTVAGQPFDPSSGQSYADVATRHARSRQGIPQEELSAMSSYTPLAGEGGVKGAVVGAGKEGLQTVQTVVGAANKAAKYLDPLDSPQRPTPQIPIPGQTVDTQPRGTAENIGAMGENILEFISGDAALKSLSIGQKMSKLARVAKILEDHPLLTKAANIGANSLRTGAVGAGQATLHGATPGEALTQGAITGVLGGALETVATAADWIKVRLSDGKMYEVHPEDMQELKRRDPGLKVLSVEKSAEQSAPNALPAQEAGQRVQQEASAIRDTKGKQLGAAKETMQQSLPITSTGEPVSMTLAPESKSATTAKSILENVQSASKVGMKDAAMQDVEQLANQFASGQDAAGNPLSLNSNEIDAVKRSLGAKIDALKVQVRNGANGNALGYLKQLKSAFEEDVFDFYGKVGDPEAAANAKQLSKEYARIVQEQTKGPAKDLLKSAKPEQIVSRIANANSQSAVESLARNLSPEGLDMLRDSVTKDIYRRNTLPNGDIDMLAVQKHLAKMGDAAKSLYGDRLADLKAFIDAAADLQKVNAAKAMPLKARIVSKAATGLGALAGGTVGSVAGPVGIGVGAIAGEVAGEKLGTKLGTMIIGKSGAVKVGISPTEMITVAPKQAAQPGMMRMLTRFAASVVQAGSEAGSRTVPAIYFAIKNQQRSLSDQE